MPKRPKDQEVIGNVAAAEYISKISGSNVEPVTWRAWVSREYAPQPHRREITPSGHAQPVWTEAALDEWQRNRRGQGWRAGGTS